MVNPSIRWEGYVRDGRGVGRRMVLYDRGVVSESKVSMSVRSIMALCNDEGLKGTRART